MAQTPPQGRARCVSPGFGWLRRGHRGPSYVSYASLSERSACGFEFGADGVAGCCNYGGELLQMAAPSARNGLIFARGDFSQSLHTWVARSQSVTGGASTFGLKMTTNMLDSGPSGGVVPVEGKEPSISSVRLDSIDDRGCFNYRWPFTEYSLLRNKSEESRYKREESRYKLAGTCFTLAFVKDQVLYQILRLEEGNSAPTKDNIFPVFPQEATVALSIGGAIRFDSFDTTKSTYYSPPQKVSCSLKDNGRRAVIHDSELHLRLEALVYRVNVSPEPSVDREPSVDAWEPLTLTKLVEEFSWGEASEKQHTANYPPFQVVYNIPKRSKNPRDAVFVAAFKLMDSSIPPDYTWDPKLSEEEVHDYVTGPQHICDNCRPGSPLDTQYPLLDAPLVDHMEQIAAFINYWDVGMICRCLEMTLQIGTVPAYPTPSTPDDRAVTGAKIPPDAREVACKEEALPLALVSNLFMQPDVNLKSLFWKVRFLTKYHGLLLSLLSSTPAPKPATTAIIRQQGCRIKTHIKRLIQYLVDAFLHPAAERKQPYFLLPVDIVAADARYYYVLPTIWCAVRAIPDLGLDLTKLSTLEKVELSRVNRLPDDGSTCAFWSRDTVLLLQWYHSASLLKLSEKDEETWGNLVDTQSRKDKASKASQLCQEATLTSAAKLASETPYSTGDEIFDRLASLAPELEFDGGKTVASMSSRRIRQRSLTKEINPGKPPDDDESANLNGPWEVNALCHHSRLKAIDFGTSNPAQLELWASEEWKREVQLYKQKLYHFLNAEGTLVSTWERVDSHARRGLLRSETTAVVVSTLLDLYRALAPTWSSTDARELYGTSGAAARHRESNEGSPGTEKDGRAPFSWSRLAPTRIYHPPNFTDSLDDTPERYMYYDLMEIPVPAALDGHYVDPPQKGLSMDTINNIPDLDRVSLIDIVPYGSVRNTRMDETLSEKRKRSKWKKWVPSLSVEPLSKDWRNDLKWRLYDSLVDQEVCHRFLGVGLGLRPDSSTQDEKDKNSIGGIPSKEMVTMLMYIAHPEAVSCLASHFLKMPRFVPVQHRTKWLARITLRSWKRFHLPPDTNDRPTTDTNDRPTTDTYDQPIRLPKNLLEPLEALKGYKEGGNLEFHLQVSSFVITTTALGDFGKCTIISDLITEEQLKDLAEDSLDIWEMFVHQPQAARCIVFLRVLRELCRVIARDYQSAMEYFFGMISLEDCLKGEDWEKEKGALGKFQLGLWSLDSLSILQVSLKESVNSILEAKELLLAQIHQGPGTRCEALENIWEWHLVQFDNVLARLMWVNSRLESCMTLNGSYKDAMSTLLALKASQTGLAQNAITVNQSRTIQKLTYLTITYLPLSLMAALLSIDDKRAVTPSDGGTTWYVGASMILLVFTIALAGHIGTIVGCIGTIVDFFLVWPHKQLKMAMEKSGKTSVAEEVLKEHYNLWLWLLVPGIAARSARALWHRIGKTCAFVWGRVRQGLVSLVKWVLLQEGRLPR